MTLASPAFAPTSAEPRAPLTPARVLCPLPFMSSGQQSAGSSLPSPAPESCPSQMWRQSLALPPQTDKHWGCPTGPPTSHSAAPAGAAEGGRQE